MNQKHEYTRHAVKRVGFAGWWMVCGIILGGGIAMSAADDAAPANLPKTELVYVGSGTKDIRVYRMDLDTGALTPTGDATPIAHPSFLTLSPDHRFLYSVTEGGSKNSSSVSAFSLDRQSGKLAFINTQPSGGAGPCHVAVDATGKAVLAANYSSGSMAVFPVKEGGALGEMSAFFQGHGSGVNPERQEGPHAHCVTIDPGNRFALLCDLGQDKVFVFKFDATNGSITPNDPPFASVKPGSGPRHITFHPNGRFAYLINEMASTLTAFEYDAGRGTLREFQTESTLPAGYTTPSTAAEVAVHPSGKFLYGSNRGHDSIVEFAVDGATGRLTLVGWCPTQGKTPRNFEIDPTGAFLLAANQDSNTIIVFRIDPNTGALAPAGQKIEVDTPMCVKSFIP
jgi:6-phosphogluconolactonase